MSSPSETVQIAREHLKAIQAGSADQALAQFISLDIVQEEQRTPEQNSRLRGHPTKPC
jgi:hypothetical protein